MSGYSLLQLDQPELCSKANCSAATVTPTAVNSAAFPDRQPVKVAEPPAYAAVILAAGSGDGVAPECICGHNGRETYACSNYGLNCMRIRRQTVEHPFGTLNSWMGSAHFLTRTLERVSTEMSLQVLAYNLKRVMKILGVAALIGAMQAP